MQPPRGGYFSVGDQGPGPPLAPVRVLRDVFCDSLVSADVADTVALSFHVVRLFSLRNATVMSGAFRRSRTAMLAVGGGPLA